MTILCSIITVSAAISTASFFSTLTYHQTHKVSSFPGTPSSVVYDPENGLIYVSSYYANTISIYNPVNSTIIKVIDTSIGPEKGLFDPFNNHIYFANIEASIDNYSALITVINSSTNNITGTINLGNFNSVENMVLDDATGSVFALTDGDLYSINGTHLHRENVSDFVFPSTQYALDSNASIGFMLISQYSSVYSLKMLSNNTSKVSQFRHFGTLSSVSAFMSFIQSTDQLFVSTNEYLYSVNPSNLSGIQYAIQLPQNKLVGNGVSSLTYFPSTNSIYVTQYGHHNIRVYNDSNGDFLGVIRVGNGNLYPSSLTVGRNGALLVVAGDSLFSVEPVLSIPEPFWPLFIGVTLVAVSSSIFSTLRYVIWRKKQH